MFIVLEIILGISVSLLSGTDVAMIYDTLDALNIKDSQIKYLGQSLFYSGTGEALGALTASFCLIFLTLDHLAFVSAFFAWLPLFIALTLLEPSRQLMQKKKHLENIFYIYKCLFHHSNLLTLIIFNIIFLNKKNLIIY